MGRHKHIKKQMDTKHKPRLNRQKNILNEGAFDLGAFDRIWRFIWGRLTGVTKTRGFWPGAIDRGAIDRLPGSPDLTRNLWDFCCTIFTGPLLFLSLNQQCQIAERSKTWFWTNILKSSFWVSEKIHLFVYRIISVWYAGLILPFLEYSFLLL